MDNNLVVFKTITNFVGELTELFGNKQRSLKLYSRLINKTTVSHTAAIQKHISAFRKFCVENRSAILAKNASELSTMIVKYSDKVQINFEAIFKMADRDTSSIIWKHLLYISALVDPAGKAKEFLVSATQESGEAAFLNNIFEKVEQSVDPENTDPMAAMSSVMQSGVLSELMGGMSQGMNDGSLNIGKMMGMVTGILSNMQNMPGSEEAGGSDMSGMMAMMSNMMQSMGNMEEVGAFAQESSSIGGRIGERLQGSAGSGPTVEDVTESAEEQTSTLQTITDASTDVSTDVSTDAIQPETVLEDEDSEELPNLE